MPTLRRCNCLPARRHLARASLSALLLSLAGCGDDPAGPGGPGTPDIVGTYAGTWGIRITGPSPGQEAEFSCPGIANVSRQDADGRFAGEWTQGAAPNCSVVFGTMAGNVAPDGTLLVSEFGSGQSFEESTGGQCTLVSGAEFYTGTADGYAFRISRTATADCQGTEIKFTWTLSATE